MTYSEAFKIITAFAALLSLTEIVVGAEPNHHIDCSLPNHSIDCTPDPFAEAHEIDYSLRWLPKTPLFEDGGPRMLCDRDGNM